MNKKDLILKYFQKKDQLTIRNPSYGHSVSSLFQWLIDNDTVKKDSTTKYFPNLSIKANIISKDKGVLAGLEEIEYLLKFHTSLSVKPKLSDGKKFKERDIIAEISGKSHDILAYERTILNILQRMSGIATETNRLINLINHQPFMAATRKTPWMTLDKKAVALGGGLTHRLNLFDGILIKDNHLANISVAEALKNVLDKAEGELIDIEVKNEKEALSAIRTYQGFINTNRQPPTTNHLAILFDNFTPSTVKSLLNNLRNSFDLSSIIFEASGGIDEKNIKEWSTTGVDLISLGALTHSAKTADLSLDFIKS